MNIAREKKLAAEKEKAKKFRLSNLGIKPV
jgi:hypothetical protein